MSMKEQHTLMTVSKTLVLGTYTHHSGWPLFSDLPDERVTYTSISSKTKRAGDLKA
jgi:hypothetical protein